MKPINLFKSSLTALYQEVLEIKLADSGSGRNSEPEWRSVSSNDFLSAGDDVGLLLDPEIGLAMFVIQHNSGNDLNSEIRQALKVSDRLQPAYLPTIADDKGTWQICLLWLVTGDAQEKEWKESIADRRKQSGFSEEISLDAIFFDHSDDIREVILQRGLPQLLLQTRKLFRMDKDSMSRWHSANNEVSKMLEAFPQKFSDPAQKEIAEYLVNQALAQTITSEIEPYPESPKSINHLKITNFRNIDFCKLTLNSTLNQNEVVTKVIFGPNGTGKTSLFEALSLGLCGTSKKLQNYLKDPDVVPRKPYLEHVLRPLKPGAPNPEVIINEEVWPSFPDKPDSAGQQLQLMEGSLLEQEDSHMFANIDKGELAARVLRGYSTLADYVQQKAEEGYQQENGRRQALLSEYGLNLAIRKIETLREKVLEKVLAKELPVPPIYLVTWLQRIGNLLPEGRQWLALSDGWDYWSKENLKFVFSDFIKSGSQNSLNSFLLARMKRKRQLVEDSERALIALRTRAESLRMDIDLVIGDIQVWAAWMQSQSEPNATESPLVELESINANLLLKQKERDRLSDQGKILRARQEHLEQAKQFLSTWALSHPDECPTCAADHHDHGGILAVTNQLKEINTQQLADLRGQYSQVNLDIKSLETQLSVLGQVACPITLERRDEINGMLRGLTPDEGIESWLKTVSEVNRIIETLQNLKVLPTLPAIPEKDESETERIASDIMSRLHEANRVWVAPEHWDSVKKTLSASCMEIVQSHMPRTLQAVWSELLYTLTPARWNLAAEPKFDFKLSRGSNEMRVVAEKMDRKVLARYLFNQAEIHLLGLAWFFMRYFSNGRFRHAFVAMDDPAQEMDQTTYRVFTRFMQTLVRLHKQHQRPFSLLLFMHQEDRALDAARAMGSVLNVLGWEKEQVKDGQANHRLLEVKLLSEQFQSINAYALYREAKATSIAS